MHILSPCLKIPLRLRFNTSKTNVFLDPAKVAYTNTKYVNTFLSGLCFIKPNFLFKLIHFLCNSDKVYIIIIFVFVILVLNRIKVKFSNTVIKLEYMPDFMKLGLGLQLHIIR